MSLFFCIYLFGSLNIENRIGYRKDSWPLIWCHLAKENVISMRFSESYGRRVFGFKSIQCSYANHMHSFRLISYRFGLRLSVVHTVLYLSVRLIAFESFGTHWHKFDIKRTHLVSFFCWLFSFWIASLFIFQFFPSFFLFSQLSF